jgi:CRISPR-associated protein Cas6
MMFTQEPRTPQAAMVDIGFTVDGVALPREHRLALADALESALPWLSAVPGAAVHQLKLPAGAEAQTPLSRRTRLRLRIPREHAAQAEQLQGRELHLGTHCLRVGAPEQRELLPHGTLYSHFVSIDDPADRDEAVFSSGVLAGLAALGVTCRAICGRAQLDATAGVRGFSLMLDGLSREGSLRILEAGLGRHRRLGCGVFVPHRSASAVGAPD